MQINDVQKEIGGGRRDNFNARSHFLVVWLVMFSPWCLIVLFGGISLLKILAFVVLECLAVVISLAETKAAEHWGTPCCQE